MMPHNKIMIPLFLFLLLFSTPSIALEEMVVLQPGPEEGIDTGIWNIFDDPDPGKSPGMFAVSNGEDLPIRIWAFGLVKFALPPGLNTENVISAQLELRVSHVASYPPDTTKNEDTIGVKVNVHRVSEPWEEISVWSHLPLDDYPDSQALFNENVEAFDFATADAWMSFEVTDLVKEWVSDPSSNHGVLLATPDSEVHSSGVNSVGMYTSDFAEPLYLHYRPKLIIIIETPTATIDFHPDTLNLKSKGQWMTCYIELPEGHDVEDISINTIAITSISVNGEEAEVGDCDGNGILDGIPAEDQPTEVGDYDEDGIPDLMVKFDRGCIQKGITDLMDEFDTHTESVQEATPVVGLAKVKINIYFDTDLTGFKGFDTDSTGFEGFDEVDIIDKGN